VNRDPQAAEILRLKQVVSFCFILMWVILILLILQVQSLQLQLGQCGNRAGLSE
jgi:hypothetical protein